MLEASFFLYCTGWNSISAVSSAQCYSFWQINVVADCFYKPCVSSHSVALSSAECSHCSPPSSLVCGQLLTICDIVWHLSQGRMSVAARPDFFRQDVPWLGFVWARERCRISLPRFLAECCKRQLNQGSFVLLYFRLFTFSDLYWVCLSVFSFTVLFVSISQVIGREDRLRNDLYCVEWGVKLYSNQPTPTSLKRYAPDRFGNFRRPHNSLSAALDFQQYNSFLAVFYSNPKRTVLS